MHKIDNPGELHAILKRSASTVASKTAEPDLMRWKHLYSEAYEAIQSTYFRLFYFPTRKDISLYRQRVGDTVMTVQPLKK